MVHDLYYNLIYIRGKKYNVNLYDGPNIICSLTVQNESNVILPPALIMLIKPDSKCNRHCALGIPIKCDPSSIHPSLRSDPYYILMEDAPIERTVINDMEDGLNYMVKNYSLGKGIHSKLFTPDVRDPFDKYILDTINHIQNNIRLEHLKHTGLDVGYTKYHLSRLAELIKA